MFLAVWEGPHEASETQPDPSALTFAPFPPPGFLTDCHAGFQALAPWPVFACPLPLVVLVANGPLTGLMQFTGLVTHQPDTFNSCVFHFGTIYFSIL